MKYTNIHQDVRKYKLSGIWWHKPRCFSHTWASVWNGNWAGTPAESNRKQYEYKLCHEMAVREFNDREIVALVYAWWARHRIEPDYQRLITVVIPKVRKFTAGTVAAARAHRNRAKRVRRHQRRVQPSTRERIVARVWENPFTSVGDLSEALKITRDAAKKQLQRLTKEGLLLKTKTGYEVAK